MSWSYLSRLRRLEKNLLASENVIIETVAWGGGGGRRDGVKAYDGVAASAIGSKGEQSEAKEYIPGGFLVISFSTIEEPVEGAVLSAYPVKQRFEIFGAKDGERVDREHL